MAWPHASRPAGAVLKKRFDDIFDSARYTKARLSVVNELDAIDAVVRESECRDGRVDGGGATSCHCDAIDAAHASRERRGSVATASFHAGPRRA